MDANQQLSNAAAARSQPKKDEANVGLIENLFQSFERALGGAFKVAGLNFMSKIGEVGVFANVKLEDAAFKAGKMINEGAGNFGLRGGPGAEMILGGLQFDSIRNFEQLVKAAIEPIQQMVADGMQGQHVSYGESGNLYVQAGLPSLISAGGREMT